MQRGFKLFALPSLRQVWNQPEGPGLMRCGQHTATGRHRTIRAPLEVGAPPPSETAENSDTVAVSVPCAVSAAGCMMCSGYQAHRDEPDLPGRSCVRALCAMCSSFSKTGPAGSSPSLTGRGCCLCRAVPGGTGRCGGGAARWVTRWPWAWVQVCGSPWPWCWQRCSRTACRALGTSAAAGLADPRWTGCSFVCTRCGACPASSKFDRVCRAGPRRSRRCLRTVPLTFHKLLATCCQCLLATPPWSNGVVRGCVCAVA